MDGLFCVQSTKERMPCGAPSEFPPDHRSYPMLAVGGRATEWLSIDMLRIGIHDEYDNAKKAPGLRVPVSIIHGDKCVQPVGQGQG